MAELFVNDISTTLASSAGSGTTNLQLTSAAGLPTMAAGDVLRARIEPASPTGVFELVWGTALSGTTFTVTRGQEGTSAQAWSAGDRVSFVATAATFSGIVGAGDVAYILARDHGTLDPTGAADNATVLRACYAQALTALSAGAKSTEIIFPAGTFKMASNGTGGGLGAMILRSTSGGHTGTVRVRGQGVTATTFKLTTTTPTLVATNTSDTAGVYGNVIFERFTVDRNNITGVGRTAVFSITGGNYNIDKVTLENVNIVNMGAPGFVVTTGLICSSSASTWNPSTFRSVTNITVRHCDFAGGNYGISMQSLNSTLNTTSRTDASILAGGNASAVFFDNIVIEDFKWDSGCTNFAPVNAAGDSAGVMLGSGGVVGRARLTDCAVKGSLDVGYEVDTAYDVVYTRCTSEDAMNSHFYWRPTFGGAPEVNAPSGATGPAYDRLNYALIDCSARNNKLASTSQGTTLSAGNSFNKGFYVHAKDYGGLAGNVTIRNFNYYSDGPQGLYATSALNRITGGFRNIDIDNVRVSLTGLDVNQSYGITTNALLIGIRNGRGKIRVRGLHTTISGKHSGTGAMTFQTLRIDNLADYNIDIDGVHTRYNVTQVGAASKPNYTEVIFAQDASSPGDFAGGTLAFVNGWRSDLVASGQATADFVVASNTLSLTSPGTTEYRLTQVCDEDQTDYNYGQVGPVTDQNTSVQCTRPTTVTSAYKQGVRLKVDAATGTNSLHCYVDYDGTNYRLRIDSEVAGVLTNRASTTIGTSIASPFWVRGKIKENVVTAEYLTAATTGTIAPSPAFTATYTVNNTDGTLALFGGQANQGYPGLVWVPVDSGSTTKNVVNYHCSVVSGRIANVGPLHVANTATVNVLKLNNPADPPSMWRNRGTIELPNWDLYPYATVGLAGTPYLTDTSLLATMRRNRWNYVTPPASSAITPSGSPFTYTNQDGYDEDIAVYGGTVSNVSVTRAGGSASQVASTTGVVVRIAPGASVTVTYSVAPTMNKVPVP